METHLEELLINFTLDLEPNYWFTVIFGDVDAEHDMILWQAEETSDSDTSITALTQDCIWLGTLYDPQYALDQN